MDRLDGRTYKNCKSEKWIKSIETWPKWAMNEQNAQAQKKLYNKIKIFSCNILWGTASKQNVIYMNLSIKV